MQQKDALYNKEDFTEEDGELQCWKEFESSGWEAETEIGQLPACLGLTRTFV